MQVVSYKMYLVQIFQLENKTVFMKLDPMQQVWWSSPDEKGIILFRNGNKYEGNISMKNMHGEGRFQWSDGTVYTVN